MQDSGYNKIEIRTTPAEVYGSSARPGVGIQILIDGAVYTDGDDYYVDIESFFKALTEPDAIIQFVGGCHIPECCANGAWTKLTSEAWVWNDYRIRLCWQNVFEVASEMLNVIEDHTGRGEEVWYAEPGRMEFYRKQLENAENWVTLP